MNTGGTELCGGATGSRKWELTWRNGSPTQQAYCDIPRADTTLRAGLQVPQSLYPAA